MMYTNVVLSIIMLVLSTVIVVVSVRDWLMKKSQNAPEQPAEVVSVA